MQPQLPLRLTGRRLVLTDDNFKVRKWIEALCGTGLVKKDPQILLHTKQLA